MSEIVLTSFEHIEHCDFYFLQKEYLPDSKTEVLKNNSKDFPKAYIEMIKNDELIGLAFGWPRKIYFPSDNSFVLDGIAVKAEHQQSGLGKRMLNAFFMAAKYYGYSTVSVGSAGGYVENFYISNGFDPIEYKCFENDKVVVEKKFSSLNEFFNYERKNKDGFVVMQADI